MLIYCDVIHWFVDYCFVASRDILIESDWELKGTSCPGLINHLGFIFYFTLNGTIILKKKWTSCCSEEDLKLAVETINPSRNCSLRQSIKNQVRSGVIFLNNAMITGGCAKNCPPIWWQRSLFPFVILRRICCWVGLCICASNFPPSSASAPGPEPHGSSKLVRVSSATAAVCVSASATHWMSCVPSAAVRSPILAAANLNTKLIQLWA